MARWWSTGRAARRVPDDQELCRAWRSESGWPRAGAGVLMRAVRLLALDIDAPTLARIVLTCIVSYCVSTWAADGALHERGTG